MSDEHKSEAALNGCGPKPEPTVMVKVVASPSGPPEVPLGTQVIDHGVLCEKTASGWLPVDKPALTDQRTATDCLRCCIAMVLGLDYEDVPDLVGEYGSGWEVPFLKWAAERGHHALRVRSTTDGEMIPTLPSEALWIATGPTERDTNHAVVYRGEAPWHDPHTSRAGLTAITGALIFSKFSV